MSARTPRTMEEDGGPPIHLENDGQDTPPESILLDVRGYVDARTNAYAYLPAVLLSVTREVRGDKHLEYFVYQAAGATSTLRLLPDPRPLESAGILRLREDGRVGDDFLVAALHVTASRCSTRGPGRGLAGGCTSTSERGSVTSARARCSRSEANAAPWPGPTCARAS